MSNPSSHQSSRASSRHSYASEEKDDAEHKVTLVEHKKASPPPEAERASSRPTSKSSTQSASVRKDGPEVTSNTATAEGKEDVTTSPSNSRPPSASRRSGVETDVTKSSGPTPRSRRTSATEGIPSDQAPLTPEERGKWKELNVENKQLIQKLAELNNSLDKQLSKQGINVPSRVVGSGAAVTSGISPEVEKCKNRIEVLRKANNEMQKALKEHNSIKGSGFDLRNKHAQLVKMLESLRSENQSLENVNINQSSKTTQEDKMQAEIQRMRAEHNEVQRESRDAIRQLKELRESEMSNLRLLLKQQDLINEKLRFLAEEGVNLPKGGSPDAAPTSGRYALPASVKKRYSVNELQLVLQSLTTEESDIQKDIQSLTSKTHKAKWKIIAERKTTELEDLKGELALLKEHAEAKKIVI